MTSLTAENAEQYGSSEKLAARARLASAYTISGDPWFPWVASHLPLRQGDRIIDVGCGPGWFWEQAIAAVPAGIDLTLTDLSPGMVNEATKRCTRLPFQAVNGQAVGAAELPCEAASFDGAVAMHMLYHLPDPAVAIAEMYRVLKPGGFLAVTTNGTGNMRRLYELTTTFGGTPYDPVTVGFGFSDAERLIRERFGNVRFHVHVADLHITSADDIFLALTSYPPGEQADKHQLAAFMEAIRSAFTAGDGALDVQKEAGLFVAFKTDT